MINFSNQKLSIRTFAESEKLSLKSAQSGRSMIEMLGVLAIIGVLSVGGIAGYSKAMTKFKINKTIEQVSHIVANTRTLFSSQPNYGGLQHYPSMNTTIIRKAHLVPDDMWEGSTDNIRNAFGGLVYINCTSKYSGDTSYKSFVVSFYDIPEDACIELATLDWGAATGSGLIGVGINDSAMSSTYKDCSGDTYGTTVRACPNGSSISVPMPVSIAAEACSGDRNQFSVKYY